MFFNFQSVLWTYSQRNYWKCQQPWCHVVFPPSLNVTLLLPGKFWRLRWASTYSSLLMNIVLAVLETTCWSRIFKLLPVEDEGGIFAHNFYSLCCCFLQLQSGTTFASIFQHDVSVQHGFQQLQRIWGWKSPKF